MELENFGEYTRRIADEMIKTLNNYKVLSVAGPEIEIHEKVIAVRSYPNEPI